MSPNYLADAVIVQFLQESLAVDDSPWLHSCKVRPLDMAIWFGLETISKKLLEHLDFQNPSLSTTGERITIAWAAKKGLLQVICLLISTEFDSEVVKELIELVLDISIIYGHDHIVQSVLGSIQEMKFSLHTVLQATRAENISAGLCWCCCRCCIKSCSSEFCLGRSSRK